MRSSFVEVAFSIRRAARLAAILVGGAVGLLAVAIALLFWPGNERWALSTGALDGVSVVSSEYPHRSAWLQLDHASRSMSPGGVVIAGAEKSPWRFPGECLPQYSLSMTNLLTRRRLNYCVPLADLREYGFTEDGSRIAAVGRYGSRSAPLTLTVFDTSTNAASTLLTLRGDYLTRCPSWSRDGKVLVLSWGGITYVLVDGRLRRTFEGRYAEVSPDGTRVAYQPRPGTVAVAEISSGIEVRRLATQDRCFPSWSLNGRALLIARVRMLPLPRQVLELVEVESGQVLTHWSLIPGYPDSSLSWVPSPGVSEGPKT